jgi:hypothetical protein
MHTLHSILHRDHVAVVLTQEIAHDLLERRVVLEKQDLLRAADSFPCTRKFGVEIAAGKGDSEAWS